MNTNTRWTTKYEPTSLDDMVLNKQTRKRLQHVFDNPCSSFLYGLPGTGKTTFLNILKQNPEYIFMHFNGSSGSSVTFVKNEVEKYCQVGGTVSGDSIITGTVNKRRYLVYNEVDKLSQAAQSLLREIQETHCHKICFFFMTNDINSIDEPLLNRFVSVEMLRQSHDDIKEYCNKILEAENATIDTKTLNKIVSDYHPSMRKIITELEINSTVV